MRRFGKPWLVAPVLGVLAWLAASPPARADFIMRLHEDGYTYTGPGAQNGDLVLRDTTNSGEITFNGSFGDFTAKTQATGATNQVNPGDKSIAAMTIDGNIYLNSGASGQKTLTITLSDTGFTFPGGNTSALAMKSSFGGTILSTNTKDGTTFASYADAGNNLEGTSGSTVTGAPLLSANSNGDVLGTDYSGSSKASFTRNGPYSVTNVTTITITPVAGKSDQSTRIANETALSGSSGSGIASVPEPGTLALGLTGFVLAGLRGWVRRKRVGRPE